MGCKVTISAECQVEVTDPQGVVTGTKWQVNAEAKKNQLVRVIAKMTDTCKAKVDISKKDSVGPMSLLTVKSAPGTPSSEACTKYREVIFWASEVNHAAGEPVPETKFTATANCGDCACDDTKKVDTDTCVQKFTDH